MSQQPPQVSYFDPGRQSVGHVKAGGERFFQEDRTTYVKPKADGFIKNRSKGIGRGEKIETLRRRNNRDKKEAEDSVGLAEKAKTLGLIVTSAEEAAMKAASAGSAKAVRKWAEASFWFFLKYVMGWAEGGVGPGPAWMYEPLHKPWADWLGREKRKGTWEVFLEPRGHGKSSIGTVAAGLWEVAKNPMTSIGLGSFKGDLSKLFLQDIKNQMVQNERLKWVWPDVFVDDPDKEADYWRSDYITIKRPQIRRDPTFAAFALEKEVTGFHFDKIFGDDFIVAENVATEALIEKTKASLFRLPSLFDPGGPKIVRLTGTRWHYDDAYGAVVDPNGPFRKRCESLVGDVFGADGEPIWPTRYVAERKDDEDERECLKTLENTMGSEFYAFYRNSPIPGGEAWFQTDKVKRYVVEKDESTGRWIHPEEKAYHLYVAVDPNVMDSETGDPGVVLSGAIDEDDQLWVVDMLRGRPTPSELIRWITGACVKWRPVSVLLETVAYQKTLIHWLQKYAIEANTYLPIRELTRGGQNAPSKPARIRALTGPAESGRIWVPHGQLFDEILNEMKRYAGKSSKRDDILDCMADIYKEGSRPPKTDKRPRQKTPDSRFLLRDYFHQLEEKSAKQYIPVVTAVRSGSYG